jgi:N-acetylmuramoyl-L-alanine amidase
MDTPEEFDPIQQEPPVSEPPEPREAPEKEPPKARPRRKNDAPVKPFTFLRGLQTTLAAAFVVATLFTLWTPGSLVESSLEARMAQALQSASGDYSALAEATAESVEDPLPENIGIVSGHYGFDSGAVCANGTTEAESNLEIATLVQKKLTDMGYEVDLLEEFDDRLEGYRASVLLSIHLDSCGYINDQATGFKVASALSDQNLAASQKLTTCLSEKYEEVTGLAYHAGSVTDDMTYYHAFSEIDPQTPAAIIEAAFMNMDYQLITENPELIADGIVAGLLCFLNE